MIALSALPLLACLASAQSPGGAVRGRPTQLAESGFRDADGNMLLLLSEANPDSRLRGPLWLHMLGGVVTILVFAVWRATSFKPDAWPVVLAWIIAFFALTLSPNSTTATKLLPVLPYIFLVFG